MYTKEKLQESLINLGLTMKEDTFTTVTKGFVAFTKEGYKVVVKPDNLINKKHPRVFSKTNPYTIENIKTYIKNNELEVDLISEEYLGNSIKMRWKCSCGREYLSSWNNFLHGAHKCPECSRTQASEKRRVSFEEIVRTVSNRGYSLIEYNENFTVYDQKIILMDKDGYKYILSWGHFKNGQEPRRFYVGNPYTIENINLFLKLTNREDYVCIDKQYYGNDKLLKIKHDKCGKIFEATLLDLQGQTVSSGKYRYTKKCPFCDKRKTESIHASILKQVWIHECPSTIVEDKTCINIRTNRALPTDIVNHDLKIAIEIQSQWHDSDRRKTIDRYKKQFWIDKGYQFYDPDIREYSYLELVQLFFPSITELPNYIDYNYGDTLDCEKVQKFLDDGWSLRQVSECLNVNKGTIQAAINNKKITLPKDYKYKHKMKRKIVHLSHDGKYIETFESLKEADLKGYKSGTVIRVLKGKQEFSYGDKWMYEEDYLKQMA